MARSEYVRWREAPPKKLFLSSVRQRPGAGNGLDAIDCQSKGISVAGPVPFDERDLSTEISRRAIEIIELDRWPVGRVVSEVQQHCVYFIDFALFPQVQGIGIGTMALEAALEEPRRLKLPAPLRSFSYNWAAQRLYHRLGFRTVDDQPPYVLLEWGAE
jgi:GNAT superfamily N-acetyltransferase